MTAQFKFVIRSGPDTGKIYPLEEAEITIGRDMSNTIPINDGEISRKHARLLLQGDGYVLEDFGSTNGTFINGQRISALHTLRPGDMIAFGENVVIAYEGAVDPNATMLSTSARAVKTATAKKVAAGPPPARPAPAYSGQVPAGLPPQDAAPKKSKKVIWIVLAVVLLVCICVVALLLFFAPASFWCMLPVDWGAGACL
ncbi:MAG: FHA domain-containing protein [Chloroflexota bacterium]